MQPSFKDASLKVTKALPAGAASTTSDFIDTGVTSRGDQPRGYEVQLTFPTLTLTQLPNTKTVTYDVLASDSADGSNPVVVASGLKVQTGATGTDPLVGGTARWKPTAATKRYLGVKATGVATADPSASSFTVELVF